MGTNMIIGNRNYELGHTYVCGIVNATPDSFSDGGKNNVIDNALFNIEEMINDGMDLVDIGGESTRPGYTMISDEEEIDRVLPLIEAVKNSFDIPISLDTYKSKVAAAGINAGVDLINDIWGLKYDSNMASLIANNNISCCIMHNRNDKNYNIFIKDVINDLKESLDFAIMSGISKDRIMIDPGVGFAKSYEQNLEVMKRMDELNILGYPILLGSSRKSVIGLTLDLPVTERLEGTLVTTVLAVKMGALFVRVHDVKANVRAIKMAEKLFI